MFVLRTSHSSLLGLIYFFITEFRHPLFFLLSTQGHSGIFFSPFLWMIMAPFFPQRCPEILGFWSDIMDVKPFTETFLFCSAKLRTNKLLYLLLGCFFSLLEIYYVWWIYYATLWLRVVCSHLFFPHHFLTQSFYCFFFFGRNALMGITGTLRRSTAKVTLFQPQLSTVFKISCLIKSLFSCQT